MNDTNPTGAEVVAKLRGAGWSVAVHNDYRLNGEAYTFWLWTREDGRFVKGEGRSDDEALAACYEAAALLERLAPAAGVGREPTEAMVEAGARFEMGCRRDCSLGSNRAIAVWQAMCDAALSAPGDGGDAYQAGQAAGLRRAAEVAAEASDDASDADNEYDGGSGACGYRMACSAIERAILALSAPPVGLGGGE